MFFGLVGLNQVYFSCCGGYFLGGMSFGWLGTKGWEWRLWDGS